MEESLRDLLRQKLDLFLELWIFALAPENHPGEIREVELLRRRTMRDCPTVDVELSLLFFDFLLEDLHAIAERRLDQALSGRER
ncbi:MAG: hypothetical protein IPL39_23855 [Opitutaceae bacterium]|nr:hypothetical protein [Opitutaceae bacterium]